MDTGQDLGLNEGQSVDLPELGPVGCLDLACFGVQF
jgi:hypothetical protein